MRVSLCAAAITSEHDTCGKRSGFDQCHVESFSFGKESLAAAQHDGIDVKAVLVHHVVLGKRLCQHAASIEKNVPAWLLLEPADRSDDVVANDGRLPPC